MKENLSRRERERLARRDGIVAAAERIFVEKGFEAASMDEIAREAEFTKRTLYQYFPGKEELYAAVVLKGFQALIAYLAKGAEGEQDGFGKLRSAFRSYYAFYRDFPGTFRIISRWGYLKKSIPPEAPELAELSRFNGRMFADLSSLIREGMADGSVRGDLPVEPTVFSLVFLLTGFITQLSFTGESFTESLGLDPEVFVESTMDLILGNLAPAAKGRKR